MENFKTIQQSEDLREPVEFYAFTTPTQVFRYCDSNQDESFEGFTWISSVFLGRDDIEVIPNTFPDLVITLDLENEVSTYLKNSIQPGLVKCTVKSAHRKFDGSFTDSIVIIDGNLKNFKLSGDTIKLSIGSAQSGQLLTIGNRRVSSQCTYSHGYLPCPVDLQNHVVEGTVINRLGKKIFVDVLNFSSLVIRNKFIRGFIESNGESRAITEIEYSPDAIIVDVLPDFVTVGSIIRIFPGCNLGTDCKDFYGDETNFGRARGSFPTLPVVDAFKSGVKI